MWENKIPAQAHDAACARARSYVRKGHELILFLDHFLVMNSTILFFFSIQKLF
jgi:hypothetical protein